MSKQGVAPAHVPVRVGGQARHLEPSARFDPTADGLATLPRSWARQFGSRAEAPALSSDAGVLSYGELELATRQAAGRLAGAGLAAGDRLLVSAESSPTLVIAMVAALRMGLVMIPANTAYRETEIAHLLVDAEPAGALVDDPARGSWIRTAAPRIPVLGPAVEVDERPSPALDAADPAAPALIAYTSGTTGRPKGAVLSHANLLASLEALRLAWRWTPDDRLLLALPLFHMHGLGVGLFGSLHAGASVCLLPRFEPDLLFDRIEAGEGSLFFGVPTMYHRLVEDPRADALARLRLCVSGSAPLSGELHRRFEARTGQRIVERYGMTETAMLVSNPYAGERRPGTVGLPLPGVELRLVGESGEPGETGEIQVRGPNVFGGYWQRPDANAEAFSDDGWFRTGDIGRLDEAGYVEICGRAKELVISGGYNVYPREVEDAVRLHPGVEDVAVVGAPSEEWGETVTAYLVGNAPPGLEELQAFLEQGLARYKWPRCVHVVEALPRNALGKVQKQRLADGRVLPEAGS